MDQTEELLISFELEEIAWCSRTRGYRLMFPNSRSPDVLELDEIAWYSRTRGDRLMFSNSRRSPEVLELEEIAWYSRTRGGCLMFSNWRKSLDVLESFEFYDAMKLQSAIDYWTNSARPKCKAYLIVRYCCNIYLLANFNTTFINFSLNFAKS